MKKKFIIFFMSFILSTLGYRVYAAINVVIPDTIVTVGNTCLVPINVSSVSNDTIYSYQIRLLYNEHVIQINSVKVQGTLSTQWLPMVPLTNNSQPGVFELGNFGLSPLRGEGPLLFLEIAAVGAHLDSTTLRLDPFFFNAGNPASVTNDGLIKIQERLISISFVTNIEHPLQIKIDGKNQITPFDTTWFKGTQHSVVVESPQYPAAGTRISFDSWSDGGDASHLVTPVSDSVFYCNMIIEHLLTVQSEHGTAIGNGWYGHGETATISVDSMTLNGEATRCIFTEWEGLGDGSYSGNNREVELIINNPIIETANFATQHHLKILSQLGAFVGDGWHNEGDTVTVCVDSIVYINAGNRYLFDSWVGTGEGSYTGKQRECKVIINSLIFETAVWRQEFYLSVFSDPVDIFSFQQAGWYLKNDTLLSIAASDLIEYSLQKYKFRTWELDGNVFAQNPCTVIMDTNHVLQATYFLDSVLVSINNNLNVNANIAIDENVYETPYRKYWQFLSEHTIAVDSIIALDGDSLTRFIFDGWSDGGSRVHSVKADSVLFLEANLLRQFFLFVDTEPPGIFEFAEKGWHNDGDTILLPEVPLEFTSEQDTLSFSFWLIDNEPVTDNSINIIMDSSHSAIADYEYLFFISGLVADKRNQMAMGIKLIISGALEDTVITNRNGYFFFGSLANDFYRVTPQADWALFDPPYREYAPLNKVKTKQNFTAIDIIAPEVNLISPNGGDELMQATADTISWMAADNIGVDSIYIHLSLNAGKSWQVIQTFAEADIDFFIWDVPEEQSDSCLIRITAVDLDGNRATDQSEKMFSIYETTDLTEFHDPSLPTSFELLQNYPNPFNSNTVIQFQLPTACLVKINIYNSIGQIICELVNEHFDAGIHQISWNGRNNFGEKVCSGIYLYRISTTSNEVKIKKMLYLR